MVHTFVRGRTIRTYGVHTTLLYDPNDAYVIVGLHVDVASPSITPSKPTVAKADIYVATMLQQIIARRYPGLVRYFSIEFAVVPTSEHDTCTGLVYAVRDTIYTDFTRHKVNKDLVLHTSSFITKRVVQRIPNCTESIVSTTNIKSTPSGGCSVVATHTLLGKCPVLNFKIQYEKKPVQWFVPIYVRRPNAGTSPTLHTRGQIHIPTVVLRPDDKYDAVVHGTPRTYDQPHHTIWTRRWRSDAHRTLDIYNPPTFRFPGTWTERTWLPVCQSKSRDSTPQKRSQDDETPLST